MIDLAHLGFLFITHPLLQDRYRELMRVSRIWRDLQTRKRFGFGHDTGQQVGKGDLALFCPACPQPGINLPSDWKAEADQCVNVERLPRHLTHKFPKVALSPLHCRRWKLLC